MPFISQNLEKRNYEGGFSEESRIIKEYQNILAKLESVKIDKRLVDHLYQENHIKNPTYTLKDWVNSTKFESIENLVCSIADESQVCLLYECINFHILTILKEQIELLKKEKSRIDIEHSKLCSKFNELNEQFRVGM